MKLICVCGPTASGKTRLGVELAKLTGGQVISCDSMQVYRGMDIGTAKVTAEEMQGVAHHMIDVAQPEQEFSVSLYVQMADECVGRLMQQGIQPVVVGGTGLYMDSLIRGGSFAGPEPDPELRRQLTRLAETEAGRQQLMDELKKVDYESWQKLHINNTKRVIRALEVYRTTGDTISRHNQLDAQRPDKYEAVRIVLSYADREKLYQRIDSRVDIMMEQGLENEIRQLLEQGKGGSTAMQAIGYKEIAAAVRGEISMEQAVEDIKRESRRYAKRQLTWLRRYTDALWIDVDRCEDFEQLLQISTEYLRDRKVI